ncbi:SH3 domain-containing protein [Thalassococcus sp. CAU 1522]|uniref:SH3 domain-containing protein n=1 Tax=Thalassococcus arenae TaxID=2851652 RepID=A0ABS6N721_9RHOB|nr:SH3 domain-containing protein [Thalassococcus arenae]MBV2359811.1 SH3 domain-containing protein [Thalassococcus arenae]
MFRLVVITFGVLGWSWFELSGGTDFEPGENGVTLLARVDAPEIADEVPQVARATGAEGLTAIAGAAPAKLVFPSSVKHLSAQTLPAASADKLAPLAGEEIEIEIVAARVVTSAAIAGVTSADAEPDLRLITGSRVNMRNGPGTDYSVVGRLVRGDQVEILQNSGDGWVKLRALKGNRVGWMSARFVTAAN